MLAGTVVCIAQVAVKMNCPRSWTVIRSRLLAVFLFVVMLRTEKLIPRSLVPDPKAIV